MTNSITFGWLVTLMLFLGFVAGGYFVYQNIQSQTQAREFQACIDRAGKSGDAWMMQSHVSHCQNFFSVASGGRYGPQSDMTISLAMVRRPVFSSY